MHDTRERYEREIREGGGGDGERGRQENVDNLVTGGDVGEESELIRKRRESLRGQLLRG